eukprot:gene25148-4153_t
MVSYLSDMCPEPIFRNSKSMADFHADFRNEVMAPLLSVAAFAFVLFQHYSVAMFARHVMILADPSNATDAGTASTRAAAEIEAATTPATAATTTAISSYLSAELPTPSVSPYVILWTSLIAYAAWSAHGRLRNTNGGPGTSTRAVLLDVVLDKCLRPGVGLSGILAVCTTLAKTAAAIGLVKSSAPVTGSLPASITVAQALCGAAWGLAVWSAWVYVFQGSRKDAEARRKKISQHNSISPSSPSGERVGAQTPEAAPPSLGVDYNIVDGVEVEHRRSERASVDAAGAGAGPSAFNVPFSPDDDADDEAEDNANDSAGTEETAAGEDEKGDDADAAAVEAAFAKAARRRERRARIGNAITKILNGSSAGVLGRRHPLRRQRADSSGGDVGAAENELGQGGGEIHAAAKSVPAPPPSPSLISTFTAAKKGGGVRQTRQQQPNQHRAAKVSKFRTAMAEIMNISNAGIFNARRRKLSSSEAEAAATAAAAAFEGSPEDGEMQAAATPTSTTFSKMLSNTLNDTSSGLIAAKRRHSRRSFS